MFPLQTSVQLRSASLVTWGIIAINVGLYLLYSGLSSGQVDSLFFHLGVVPARYMHPSWAAEVGLPRQDVSPLLWSMFLHGGAFHLLGNMWTLWIFGPAVEERMGGVRYAVFYLLAGLAAATLHVWVNSDSVVPTVGASGAIAGVMGAYMALFPRARVVFMIPIFFYPFFFVWPAALYLLYWFGIQFFSGTLTGLAPQATGGVAWWAHVGGFVFGLLACRLFRGPSRQGRPMDPYPTHLYRRL